MSITVNPVNDPPVANGLSVATDEDASVEIALTGADPDGDPLGFSIAAPPSHGVLSGTPPQITYTPSPDFHGDDALSFKVNDGTAESQPALVSITVNPVNDPPVSIDDAATTDQEKTVTVAVLANDTDPEGDQLQVADFTQGAKGTVADGGSGALTYTPNSGFSGEDSFTYTASDGNGGSDSATVIVTVKAISGITIHITSPLAGESLSSAWTMVEGTVTNSSSVETGVSVNGISGFVDGNTFVVNHVPVFYGENTLTATAVDINGATGADSVTVQAEAVEHYLEISTVSGSGVAPFETTLIVSGNFPIHAPSLTYSGPGPAELTASENPNEYNLRIVDEGTYRFTAQASDSEGNVYTDTIAVRVYDQAMLDVLLRAKWEAMKNALIARDIPGALIYFAGDSKELYGEIYALLSDRLPQIAQIQLVQVQDNTAQYRIQKEEQFQQQTYSITYHVFFGVDEDGLWKILGY